MIKIIEERHDDENVKVLKFCCPRCGSKFKTDEYTHDVTDRNEVLYIATCPVCCKDLCWVDTL